MIRWEPVTPTVPSVPTKPTTTTTAAPSTPEGRRDALDAGKAAAWVHEQRIRLAEGRGPAEPGSGFVPTLASPIDAESRRYADEQRQRFPREPKAE